MFVFRKQHSRHLSRYGSMGVRYPSIDNGTIWKQEGVEIWPILKTLALPVCVVCRWIDEQHRSFMCIFCSWWETKLIMITMQTNTIFLPYHAFRALTDVEFFFSIKNYHISSWPKYRWCSSASVLHLYSNHFYVDPVNLNTKWRKQVQQILLPFKLSKKIVARSSISIEETQSLCSG